MKFGIAISVVILIFLAAVFYVNTQGTPDPATAATAPEKLKRIELPRDLPELYVPASSGRDATPVYNDLLTYYKQYQGQFNNGNPSEMVGSEALEMLIEAKDAGQVSKPFLDDRIPVRVSTDPDFGAGLEVLPSFALERAQAAYDSGDVRRGLELARSVFALGHRCFVHGQRLYIRQMGLILMRRGLDTLFGMKASMPDNGEKLEPWVDAIQSVDEDLFTPKMKIVASLKPHIGDLINVAKNDEDPTFRTRATLQLGVMKFNPGSVGNRRAIEAAIEELQQDPNPIIAEAAEAAEGLEREDISRMR